MNYYFRYFVQFSQFFNEILQPESNIYFHGTYVNNFKETCYNLISKRKFKFFIDPETYRFQYGGTKLFYTKYLNQFEEIKDLFIPSNQLNFNLLENMDNFNDLYKIIIRFQKKILAHSHIPLDYYASILNDENPNVSFNPIQNLSFTIAPYFEFYKINDIYYNHTLNYSKINTEDYILLRFPKTLLDDDSIVKSILNDFKINTGIILNIVELNQYNKNDLSNYFPNLIDLIHGFSLNNQKVILMNNSELGKYFKYFGLNGVCSNVLIGQRTRSYEPSHTERRGGSTNLVYIPQIERSVSFPNGETLIARNPKISKKILNNISSSNLTDRVKNYYQNLQEKLLNINQMKFSAIVKEIGKNFNKILDPMHKNRYNYILKWIELLENKFCSYFSY